MIHKIRIVPIIGTNESSDHHGDRPVRRKIRHDGTVVTANSTPQKSTEITSNISCGLMSALVLPAQPVDATQALNLSAGVSNCKVSRGRSLS
jgi:hypothetical protein